MSEIFTNIAKSVRIMSVMGLMLALAASLMAGISTASAASASDTTLSTSTTGKLTVIARVSSATDNKVVAGAAVNILSSTGLTVNKGITDNSGTFNAYLPKGIYKVVVQANGYQTFSGEAKIDAGQTLKLGASLVAIAQPSGTPAPSTDTDPISTSTPVASSSTVLGNGKLALHVTSTSLVAAFTQVQVTILDAAGKGVAKGTADTAGNFYAELPQGTYTVLVSSLGFQTSKQEIKISAGQATQLTVALAPLSATDK